MNALCSDTRPKARDVVLRACLARIKAKFARRGKSELFDDVTREEFLRAFALIPPALWEVVTEEALLRPPANDAGFVHYLPDPADWLVLAQRHTEEGQTSATEIVGEIWGAVRSCGVYGEPSLSPMAASVIDHFGGWKRFCTMESPDGVTQGLLLKHAEAVINRVSREVLFGREGRASGLLPAFAGLKRLSDEERG